MEQINLRDIKITHATNGTQIKTPTGLASFSTKAKPGCRIIALFIDFPNGTDRWSELADAIDKSELASVRNISKNRQAMYMVATADYEKNELATLISNFI